MDESIQNIKDYFEDDTKVNLAVLDILGIVDKLSLLAVFENHCAPILEDKSFLLMPKRRWNTAQGLWTNFIYDFSDFTSNIIPKARKLANN